MPPLSSALHENLRLRQELAAKVDKAERQPRPGGLGSILYWICITLALCWVFGLSVAAGDGSVAMGLDLLVRRLREDPLVAILIWLGPGVVLYGMGRAFRYVLSADPRFKKEEAPGRVTRSFLRTSKTQRDRLPECARGWV